LKKHSYSYLLVILPPSNIAKQVTNIKKKIYSETGLYSALALPPFIPLNILTLENASDTFHSTEIERSWEIKTEEFVNLKDNIFLKVNHPENIFNLRDAEESIIPLYPGFFICSLKSQEITQSFREIKKSLPVPELNFRSFSLAILKITFPDNNPWDEICWEITEERKLRKGYSGTV
jgi:hypothetical protein